MNRAGVKEGRRRGERRGGQEDREGEEVNTGEIGGLGVEVLIYIGGQERTLLR